MGGLWAGCLHGWAPRLSGVPCLLCYRSNHVTVHYVAAYCGCQVAVRPDCRGARLPSQQLLAAGQTADVFSVVGPTMLEGGLMDTING
jgi:hypothetical protein